MLSRTIVQSIAVAALVSGADAGTVYLTRARIGGAIGESFANQQGTGFSEVSWQGPPQEPSRGAMALSSAGQLQLLGGASAQSAYAPAWGWAEQSVRGNDVTFTPTQGSLLQVIPVGVSFSPVFSWSLEGTAPSWHQLFTYAEMKWSYTISSGGAVIASESFREVNDFSGHHGDTIGARSLVLNLPVGIPVDVTFSSSIVAYATGLPAEYGGATMASASGDITFGTPLGGFTGDLRQAFELPDGFTANSEQLGITNNVFSAVPAPGSLALVGAAALAGRRRRRS